jgi:heme-degrading monooxygenase HmoA
MEHACTHIWEFHVPPETEVRFLLLYGPNGEWARLFGRAKGHLQTLLLRDEGNPHRYLTVDRWQSAAAYQEFRTRFAREYHALDLQGEALTSVETNLGSFSEVDT